MITFTGGILFTQFVVMGNYFPVLLTVAIALTIPFPSLFDINAEFLGSWSTLIVALMFALHSLFIVDPTILRGVEDGATATTTIDPRFFEDVKLLNLGDPNLDIYETFKIVGAYFKTARLILAEHPELEATLIKTL